MIYIGKEPQMLWGLMDPRELSPLPPGYSYIIRKDHWVLADAPTGRMYYVGYRTLLQAVILPNFGWGCDYDRSIELPQKQLTYPEYREGIPRCSNCGAFHLPNTSTREYCWQVAMNALNYSKKNN